MRFALNYSPPAGRLFEAGIISPDLFKCPDFGDLICQARMHAPVYVHFPLNAGAGRVSAEELAEVSQLREDTATAFVNVHLCVRRADYPWLGDGDLRTVIDAAIRDVSVLCQRFGEERVILENLIYEGPARGDFLLPGVHHEVLSEVIRQTRCGFLLDLSHARIACHYAGWEPWDYLSKLPMNRLRELHVTGLAMHEGFLIDHMPMMQEDWAFFRNAMVRIRAGEWAKPQIIAFEYGGVGEGFHWRTDPEVIAEQVPRMHDMVEDAAS
jgi:uncharacterized protein (UPF0276 family)